MEPARPHVKEAPSVALTQRQQNELRELLKAGHDVYRASGNEWQIGYVIPDGVLGGHFIIVRITGLQTYPMGRVQMYVTPIIYHPNIRPSDG